MTRIILINVYFGDFPWYFPFFLKSCTTNPSIDFIIFSDNLYKGELPANVIIVPFTMDKFNKLASEKLGINISVNSPYKLCDFKPAYGLIFSDYINEYEFWGLCDLDIILGRISEFITPDLLLEYDVVSTRHDYLTGWFLLFRNRDEINRLFQKSADYIKVFTSDMHYCFDECNFKHLYLSDQNVNIMDIECDIESMEHVIQKEIKRGAIKVFYDLIMVDGLCGKMKWDNGILVYNNSFEILLYHLIRYKSNKYLLHTEWKIVPNKFFIDKYILRTESIFTLTGFIYYCYFTYFRPFFFKLSHLTKYFHSRIFARKQDICFSKSNYKNIQGNDYIFLDGETLKFDGSKDKSRIVKSKLEKDVFYIKNLPFLEFRFFSDENDKIFRLQLTEIDGSLINYVLKQ